MSSSPVQAAEPAAAPSTEVPAAPAPLALKRANSEVYRPDADSVPKRLRGMAYINTDEVSFIGNERQRRAAQALARAWATNDAGQVNEDSYLAERQELYARELKASRVLVVDDIEADGLNLAELLEWMGGDCLRRASAIRVVKPEFQAGGSEQHVGEKIASAFAGLPYRTKYTFNSAKDAEQMSVDDIIGLLSAIDFGRFMNVNQDVVVFLSTPLYELQANFFAALRARVAEGCRIKVVCYTGNFNVKGLLTTIDQLSKADSPVDSFHAVSRFVFDWDEITEDDDNEELTGSVKRYFPSTLLALAESVKRTDLFDSDGHTEIFDLNRVFSQAKVAQGSKWVRSDELALADTKQKPDESDEAFALRSDRAEKAWRLLDDHVQHIVAVNLPVDAGRAAGDQMRADEVHGFFYDETLDSEIRESARFLLENGYVSKRRQNIIKGDPVIADQLLLYAPIAHPSLVRFVAGMPKIVREEGKVIGMNVVPATADYRGTTFYGMKNISPGNPLLNEEMARFLNQI